MHNTVITIVLNVFILTGFTANSFNCLYSFILASLEKASPFQEQNLVTKKLNQISFFSETSIKQLRLFPLLQYRQEETS